MTTSKTRARASGLDGRGATGIMASNDMSADDMSGHEMGESPGSSWRLPEGAVVVVGVLMSLARGLVRLYPPAFQATFGEELLTVLAQRLAEAAADGWSTTLRVGPPELAGLLAGAAVEQWRDQRPRVVAAALGDGLGLGWPVSRRLAAAAWWLLVAVTLLWGWAMLAIGLDEGFTPRSGAALACLGLMAIGLALSWRPTVRGGLLLLLASLGLFGVMLWGAIAAPAEQWVVLTVLAVLFPIPWLAGSQWLLLAALQRRRAAGRAGQR